MTTATRTERIQDVLRSLRGASPDIIGSALVSTDGFIVASLLPAEIDEEIVSAMAAAMLGVSQRIAGELMGASPDQTYVRTEKGYAILNSAGPDSILMVLTTADAKLGLVFLDIKRRVSELARAI